MRRLLHWLRKRFYSEARWDRYCVRRYQREQADQSDRLAMRRLGDDLAAERAARAEATPRDRDAALKALVDENDRLLRRAAGGPMSGADYEAFRKNLAAAHDIKNDLTWANKAGGDEELTRTVRRFVEGVRGQPGPHEATLSHPSTGEQLVVRVDDGAAEVLNVHVSAGIRSPFSALDAVVRKHDAAIRSALSVPGAVLGPHSVVTVDDRARTVAVDHCRCKLCEQKARRERRPTRPARPPDRPSTTQTEWS